MDLTVASAFGRLGYTGIARWVHGGTPGQTVSRRLSGYKYTDEAICSIVHSRMYRVITTYKLDRKLERRQNRDPDLAKTGPTSF